MANYIYVWDSLSLVAGAIIVYCIAKKGRRSIKPFTSFFFVCWMFYGDISGDSYACREVRLIFVQYWLVLFSSSLFIVTRTSLPLVLRLIIHGLLVAILLVLWQLLTDWSDSLSELIFHSGVGKSLQKWF